MFVSKNRIGSEGQLPALAPMALWVKGLVQGPTGMWLFCWSWAWTGNLLITEPGAQPAEPHAALFYYTLLSQSTGNKVQISVFVFILPSNTMWCTHWLNRYHDCFTPPDLCVGLYVFLVSCGFQAQNTQNAFELQYGVCEKLSALSRPGPGFPLRSIVLL